MSKSSLIEDVRTRVDARLAGFFELKRLDAERISKESVVIMDEVASLTMRGGKRLRPAVLYAGLRAVSDTTTLVDVIDACAALELLQSYLLIHDDWMDSDAERRGGPTTHVSLARHYADAHRGASVAILAGDLASAWSLELLAGARWPRGRELEGVRAFARMQDEVVLGQHLDVVGHRDVALVHHLKTGSYTVRGPLALGGILGDGDEIQLDALEAFGEPMGIAFQLRDDLLGTFGDTRATGKPTGSDLRAGKRTALIEEAEKALFGQARAPLDAVLGHAEATEEQVALATALLVDCGAKTRVEARLDAMLEEAARALDTGALRATGVTMLRELRESLALRDR